MLWSKCPLLLRGSVLSILSPQISKISLLSTSLLILEPSIQKSQKQSFKKAETASYLPLFQLIWHDQHHLHLKYPIIQHQLNTATAFISGSESGFTQQRIRNKNILSAPNTVAMAINLSFPLSSKSKTIFILSFLVDRFRSTDHVSRADLRPSQFIDPIVSIHQVSPSLS